MSYPSQPSFTPPYGQQPPQPQRTNLWLVGTAVIAILAIIMTVTLLIVQRTADDDSGSDDPPVGSGDGSSEEGPTEDEPTEDDSPSEDDGGDEPSAAVEIDESACENYDLAKMEELFGEPADPDETYTSASTSGETGSVTCTFYTDDYWMMNIYVNVGDDPDFNIEWVEDDKKYWDEDDSYDVSDYDYGDAGYMSKYGDPDYLQITIDVAVSNIEIEAYSWVDTTEFDEGQAEEMLGDAIEQAHNLFSGYEM